MFLSKTAGKQQNCVFQGIFWFFEKNSLDLFKLLAAPLKIIPKLYKNYTKHWIYYFFTRLNWILLQIFFKK